MRVMRKRLHATNMRKAHSTQAIQGIDPRARAARNAQEKAAERAERTQGREKRKIGVAPSLLLRL